MRGSSLTPVVLAMCVIGACGGSAASIADSDAGAASSSSSSSSSSGGGTSSSGGSSSGDASSDAKTKDAARDANAAACPKAFSDPAPDGHCTIGLSCAYDEGTCDCVGYCGGAPPPPDQDFSHWTCTAKRTDGCPDDKPVTGSSCNSPGKNCDYGGCCIEQFVCTASKWTSSGPICPP